MQYFVIKEVFGWTIKEYKNEVPDSKFYKIFNSKEAAESFIDEQD